MNTDQDKTAKTKIKQSVVDKEYILLQEIEANSTVSQRELSQKAGLSLGSVNLLLKKMIRQGLVKMELIPANRIAYMLTPAGIAEKAFKTVRYVKIHYQVIEETKQRIISSLENLHSQYEDIYILSPEDELEKIIKQAVTEYKAKNPAATIVLIKLEESPEYLKNKIKVNKHRKTAVLSLSQDMVYERLCEEYRKYITPISLMELF